MDAKCGQFSGLFDIFGLGIQLGNALQSLMFPENLLFNSVGLHVGSGQEFFEAAKNCVVSIVVTFGRLDNN